ncbi:MAG: serine hydrolase [Candidatus Hydrogenedens sp.]|nr:serine hydrolase [Candidatus Hydrogenedens sp.]
MKNFLRFTAVMMTVTVAGVGMAVYAKRAELHRIYVLFNLFEPDRIVENFRTMDQITETVPVHRGDEVWALEAGTPMELPESFPFGGETMSTQEFIDYTNTTGLMVLHDDRVVFEKYYRGETAETRHISWSVAKSFTSALIGIALEQGQIDDIMDPVDKYAPSLAGCGYQGVPLKHVLQMASGIEFTEDYDDFFSDINRMGREIFAFNVPVEDFVRSLKNGRPSGTVHHYVSMDTQVLAMVLRGATKKSIAELTETQLWKPIGMESDAYWMVDAKGRALAFGCLNAVLRDYARFGMLYLHEGKRGDTQVVPADWVRASTTPQDDYVMPGDDLTSLDDLGYGYQWWVPVESDGDYFAIGVYNQFIYVSPKRRVVIAKTSANAHYLDDGMISESQAVQFFRAVAKVAAGE